MYAVDDQDTVVALDTLPRPSAGAPLPRLEADEFEARVTYYVWGGDEETTVTFAGVYALLFGAPNDEAFDGHPLAERGLAPYGAFEIERSSWIRALERMNRVHEAHRAASLEGLRHFVIAFHDSTLECVAESARAAGAV